MKFVCGSCGAGLTASHKPNACRECGGRQIRSVRSSSPNSGNLGKPVARPPSLSTPTTMASAPRLEPAPATVKSRMPVGIGFNLFDPKLIMTWLFVLSPLAIALGFAFYRLANFQGATGGFVHRTLQENFDRPLDGWQSVGKGLVRDGQLRHVQSQGRTQTSLTTNLFRDSATEVEVDGFAQKGQGKTAGMMTRVPADRTDDGYYLAIRDDGSYSLGIQSQGQTDPKIDWTPHNVVNTDGQPNDLKLLTNGDQITAIINNTPVGSFQDDQFQAGGISVFSDKAGVAPNGIGFNQLSVRVKERETPFSSPETAIATYYRDLNQQPDTDGWQWVFRTEIYDTKILKESPQHTAIKVGLRYHLRNGQKICESRVFTLTPDKKKQRWHISDPKAIRPEPECKL